MKPKLLLHTCCGICGAWIPEKLSQEYEVTIFYFNPNIHPIEEYKKRCAAAKQMADLMGIKFIEGEYNPREWFRAVRGLAAEKEGGARCSICFAFRLRRAAEKAQELGYEYFSSTLTVGRRKKAEIINPIGEKIAAEFALKFLSRDFKKQQGEMISQERARAESIYHQNYCGCVYSSLR